MTTPRDLRPRRNPIDLAAAATIVENEIGRFVAEHSRQAWEHEIRSRLGDRVNTPHGHATLDRWKFCDAMLDEEAVRCGVSALLNDAMPDGQLTVFARARDPIHEDFPGQVTDRKWLAARGVVVEISAHRDVPRAVVISALYGRIVA